MLDVFSAPSLALLEEWIDHCGFEDNMSRDADDKAQFDKLYGAQCHYRQPHFYDLVVDTSNISSRERWMLSRRGSLSGGKMTVSAGDEEV